MSSSTLEYNEHLTSHLSEPNALQGARLCLDDSYAWSIHIDQGRSRACISDLQETLVCEEQLDTCFVRLDSYTSENIQSTLSEVVIDLCDYSPLLPGSRVQRMGRHGWSGRVITVEVSSALVEWGGKSQEWVDRTELYPLDSSGRPCIPGKSGNIQLIAQRAQILLKKLPDRQSVGDISNTQLPLFDD